MAADIIIREILPGQEMTAVENLQKEIWNVSDLEVMPSLAMIPMREVGAVLLGAFADAEMVGFVFGFPGVERGKLILHSDLLAVKPAYRSHNLGARLKWAQREAALANGITKITWTFDPLRAANAHLNFAKLGVISRSYRENYYGTTSSPLHQHGTDRLWVEWLLDSERVKRKLNGATESEAESPTESFTLAIPDLGTASSQDIRLGIKKLREGFTNAFAKGFTAVGFRRHGKEGGFYLLDRTPGL
jgi:predicted GNAT superfamily acetyltransferase